MTTELLSKEEATGGPACELHVEVRHLGTVCVIHTRGVLHTDTLRAVQVQIDRLGRTPCRHVVLDLAGMVAVDDAGARLLTGLHHYVAGRGGRLTVVGARPQITAALA
ncbi:MAG: STAS domain-containing protein, partial [Acidimicrobiales bacterium]